MQKKIQSALISVFYKEGLEEIVLQLQKLGVVIYSTGGTQEFIERLGVSCVPVESLTSFPSILGGRVKTLHPAVFGGILGKREDAQHVAEMEKFNIPALDLVIVDLYPFEETVKATDDETLIIEKIDIGGPSMLRAAAKNHRDLLVIASKEDYSRLEEILVKQEGVTSLDERRTFAVKAFDVCTAYDIAISSYFHGSHFVHPFNQPGKTLRYGENPHQSATWYGDTSGIFEQLHGKELSYNNLVDVDAALQLIREFVEEPGCVFAIIKHTNVCGIAIRSRVEEAFQFALAGDPESAFGGILVSNTSIDEATALLVKDLFFEVLIAPGFDTGALQVLQAKKNRILLQMKKTPLNIVQSRSLLNGLLVQDNDKGNYQDWTEAGGRTASEAERANLAFANIVCKHLKSNAIAIVKNMQLVGKGCGQTSRIDALRQAIDKSHHFGFDLKEAVLASDAFFPFDDCIKIAHAAGIKAFIQPGGSIRDSDTLDYSKAHGLVMVLTHMRHFKH